MNEHEILNQLIKKLDELIKLKGWKELASDIAIKLAIEKGFAELKAYNEQLAEDFLELALAYLEADMEGMVDEAADLAAGLFKLLVFKK
jgi:hypothetical protein